MQKETVHDRMKNNAKVLRFITRAEMFEKNRKITKQISYLKCYDDQTQQAIRLSMEGPIPGQLAPVSARSISYYRRNNQPIFKTRASPDCQDLDPHMTYESLWILAGLQQAMYPNYQAVVKQFERDLQKYLQCPYLQIREMAVIAAGNKIIGKEKQVRRMVEQDKKQIWVMINHIYDSKILFTALYPYLKEDNEIIYRTIFEMSNYKGDQIIESIIKNQDVLQNIVASLTHAGAEVKKHSLCIIGNILAEKEEYALTLQKYRILDSFFHLLGSSDSSIRKDVCWAIANFAFEKGPATDVVYNQQLFERLLTLFLSETCLDVKIELGHIFSHLVTFADKKHMYEVLLDEGIIDRCNDLLDVEDPELNLVTLYLIEKILDLGNYFTNGAMSDGINVFANQIKQSDLRMKIVSKSFSCNKEISKISTDIDNMLETDDI